MERAAREIAIRTPGNPSWEDCVPTLQAVIAAMREPTAAMVASGLKQVRDLDWPDDVKEAWQAMIDALLAEFLPQVTQRPSALGQGVAAL
jgi:hypothetical protein